MHGYDALIVGGGPAGSSCAWRLQAAGWRVAVLDKKAFPRDKPCAGWITPQIVAALQLDLDDYVADGQRTWQPITGFRTGTIGGREVENRYREPVSYGIRRCEFDSYLLRRSGAELLAPQVVESLRRDQNRWIVNEAYSAPLLIGAGGHFCPVARRLGATRKPPASVVKAREVEFLASDQQLRQVTVAADTPELFFCRDLKGYGWCFRKGNYLNIGLGRLEADSLTEHVEEFSDFLRQRGKVACELTGRFVGHAYQLYEHARPKLVDDGVLLIGDAAALAYPQSGEGIRPAVESAILAADVLLRNKGDYARDALAEYPRRLEARLGAPRGGSPVGWLPAAWLEAAAGRLLATRWFARKVVIENWFLHRGQAAIAVDRADEQPTAACTAAVGRPSA